MSLLTIVQQTCRLLSLLPPDEVVTSTDAQVQLLYQLAIEEGEELSTNGDMDWQVLTQQKIFYTVADPVQVDAVPDDLDHFIDNSFFNRSTRLQMVGPITPQMWQAIQAQPQLNQVYLAFRQRDGAFLITPTPAAGNEIAYEYVSKNYVEAANGELTISGGTIDVTNFGSFKSTTSGQLTVKRIAGTDSALSFFIEIIGQARN